MRRKVFLLVFAALLLGLGLHALTSRQSAPALGTNADPRVSATGQPVGTREESHEAVPTVAYSNADPDGRDPAGPDESDLEGRFHSAKDFTALFEELMRRARAGDAEAAYYAYRIEQACSHREPDDARTVQEVLADFDQEFARYNLPGQGFAGDWRLQQRRADIERAWQACPPGLLQLLALHDEMKLLEQAADLGYPLAQATLASAMLRDDPNGLRREAALPYLREAARSRDPEVLFEIGGAVVLARQSADDEDFRRANAWRLLACWHGLDCGPDNALIRQTLCHRPGSPRCIPGAGLEHYMRSWDPDGYAETYALADQMMQAMNDGRWDDLQF